jgi:DNA (cytosine-5)-methyltransferase 1
MAEVLQPRVLLIENVPGAVHDKTQIVQRTQAFLKELGYDVGQAALRSDDYGAAQRRRRHFTLATREGNIQGVLANLASLRQEPLNVLDAIQDLINVTSDEVFDSSASHSPTNRRRIQYLFDRDIYELPDEERPDCHRLKPHSYQSVYGRLYPNEPAPTITSGFGSTGQGRFVHPLRPRTLTPHEAARLQGFPDSFSFEAASSRVALQEMIGNAVPYRLAYSVCLALLGSLA